MIEITNGLVRIKVPKKDVKTFLRIGWKEILKEQKDKKIKENKNRNNGTNKINSSSKQG